MKEKYLRLKSLILAGAVMVSGVGLTGCSSENGEEPVTQQEVTIQDFAQRFGVGEHTISVPIGSGVRSNIVQHEYHPGYEPVGITVRSYGKIMECYGGGAILYTNTSEVECNATSVGKDGYVQFTDFGTPVEYEVSSSEEVKGGKIFAPGEHIISIPLPVYIMKEESVQLPSYPGYEIVGVASSSYGEIMSADAGGALLLRNTVPVECALSDGGYNSIGIPIEQAKVKVK